MVHSSWYDRIEVQKALKNHNFEHRISKDEQGRECLDIYFNTERERDAFQEEILFYVLYSGEVKQVIERCLKCLPDEVVDELLSWKKISKSPYSLSFYNDFGIAWDSKPEGSLRLSDHWNFESRGKVHCKLNTTDEYISKTWILARYENGIYVEIKRY